MSNPFAPPGPQPPPQPYQTAYQSPYPSHPQTAPAATYPQPGYAPAPPAWSPQPLAPAPKQSNGLAIAAIITSGVALLAVLGMAAFLFVMGPGAGGSWLLEGQVAVVDKGVADSVLEKALTTAIEDDGGLVDEVSCPLRSQVGQGLVTVCRGSVDGFDWTGVVVFEDEDGAFIVTEY